MQHFQYSLRMSSLACSHDAFCKELLGRVLQAREFLALYLPHDVVGQLDLKTLAPLADSFVDPELRQHHSDLLYSVALVDGGPGLVYVLFEHKSAPEEQTAFQVLRYMVRIWESHWKNQATLPFPPVFPIVLYHGRQPWRYATSFESLVMTPPGFAAHVPRFSFHLCDLSAMNDAEIRGGALLRVGLLVMKHILNPDLAAMLPFWSSLFFELGAQHSGLDYIKIVLNYFAYAASPRRMDELYAALETALPPKGVELMPTLAEMWMERGMERGMHKGELNNMRDVTKQYLSVKFSSQSSLLAKTIESIDDYGTLRVLFNKFILATSIEECEKVVAEILH